MIPILYAFYTCHILAQTVTPPSPMVKGLNYPCYPCWDSELMCTSKLFIQLSWRKLCIWWFLPLPGTQGHFHTSLPSLIKPLSLVPFEPRLTSFALMIKASQRRSADSPSWHVAEYSHIHKPNQPRPAEPYSWTFVTKRRFLHHMLLRFVSLDSITSLRTNLRHGGGCCPVLCICSWILLPENCS